MDQLVLASINAGARFVLAIRRHSAEGRVRQSQAGEEEERHCKINGHGEFGKDWAALRGMRQRQAEDHRALWWAIKADKRAQRACRRRTFSDSQLQGRIVTQYIVGGLQRK